MDNMKDVYFTVVHDQFDDGEKIDWAIVVEKEFWDQCKGFDDTMDENLEDALAELTSIDSPETVSWDPTNVSLEDIISMMKNRGYNLLVDDERFINEFKEEHGVEPKDYYI